MIASGGGKGDGRTRNSHRHMSDVIIFWNDPPAPEDLFPTGYKNTLGHYHAGCCPNCRCSASPLVFIEDLKFPVRVYTNGKIVSMQKPEFDNLYNSRISQMKAELQREKEQAEQKKVKEELPKEKEIKTSEEIQENIQQTQNLISGALNPESKEANKHAKLYYESIRKMKTDVQNIAKNTGYSIGFIQEIKNYLFIDDQNLGNGVQKRFDPSFEIAESWERLIIGKDIKPHDLTLFRHEAKERELIQQGYTQDEAHILTSKIYNYSNEAYLYYYGSTEKHK